MKPIKLEELAAWSGAALTGTGTVNGICTDTRKITPGCLFVALRGERFDGNAFLQQALDSGAGAVMGEVPFDGAPYLQVADSGQALLDLAAGYRRQFSVPVVALTGSVGKTTTKEMIASVLSQQYCCLKTEGNLNNEIGVPLTLFRLSPEHEAAVIEMGMNHFGELSRITAAARPTGAVIHNIGMSHIENLGSREGILKAKLEILEGLQPDGTVFLNGDDAYLKELRLPYKTVFYGCGEHCSVRAEDIRAEEENRFSFRCAQLPERVHLSLAGRHQIYNALAAIAVGLTYGVPAEKIIRGIALAENVGLRMKTEQHKGITAILDCYNANPDSMRAALQVLQEAKGTRKIALLGDMLELGSYSQKAHLEVGKAASGLDGLITVGTDAEEIARGAQQVQMKRHFAAKEDACNFLQTYLQPGDTVLIKGSRGMKMEEIWNWLNMQ